MRDVEEADISETIARLAEIGQLDDERFARLYAEDKRELRGWGPQRIHDTLVARGVDAAVARAATEGEDHGDQVERAAGLLAKRGDALDDETGRKRALSFLARRGYDHEVAYAAVSRAARRAD